MAKSLIEKWTDSINSMNYDLQTWSSDVNEDQATYWGRNKTKFYALGLFGGLTIIGWLSGIDILFRICGLMLILYVVTNIGKSIGGLWKRLFKN